MSLRFPFPRFPQGCRRSTTTGWFQEQFSWRIMLDRGMRPGPKIREFTRAQSRSDLPAVGRLRAGPLRNRLPGRHNTQSIWCYLSDAVGYRNSLGTLVSNHCILRKTQA